MIHYTIMRLPISHPARFMGSDFCERHCGMPEQSDYEVVYHGNIDEININNTLEYIYYILNVNHPSDYKISSLSVSDVIGIENDNHKHEWWYVDSIGFKRIWEEN